MPRNILLILQPGLHPEIRPRTQGPPVYAFVDQPVERLTNGGRFLLWAMRGWAQATAAKQCPPVALFRGFSSVSALSALGTFHTAMALLNRHAAAQIKLAPMGCAAVAEDEAVLLGLWHDLALGRVDRTRATLALIVGDEDATGTATAMTMAAAEITGAGVELSDLAPAALKEEK